MLEELVPSILTEVGWIVPLLDDIAENPHHALRLLFRETLIFQPLHKLERVEVVVFLLRGARAEVATELKRRRAAGNKWWVCPPRLPCKLLLKCCGDRCRGAMLASR
jgi:hypothetical protein